MQEALLEVAGLAWGPGDQLASAILNGEFDDMCSWSNAGLHHHMSSA